MVFIIKIRCEEAEFWWENASDRRLMTHDCKWRTKIAALLEGG